METEYPQELKIALLGKVASGKTSLAIRFISNAFSFHGQYKSTIGVAYVSRKIEYENQKYRLQIWDTAGCERFEALGRTYYRGAKAAIICHDLLDQHSYKRATQWAEELIQQEPACMIYFCGTKKDLLNSEADRVISRADVLNFTKSIRARSLETSSKTGEGVKDLFIQVVKDFASKADLEWHGRDAVKLGHQTCDKFRCICKTS